MRLSDSLVDIASVIGGLPADFQPTTRNEAAALQALTQSSVLSNLIPGGVFTPAGEVFSSVDDIVAPVALQGDEFTAYQNTPLNMPASDFNLTGTGNRANPPPAVFDPANVVLLTDGTCGSTCTIFSYLMILEAGVRTVTMGGRPRPGPIQAIAGVEGAQVFYFADLAQAAAAAQVLGPAAGIGAADPRQLGLLADGYAIRRAMDPANAGGSVNGKNAFGKADARTPFQFLYEPANCRFFYTAEMLDRPEAAWQRAVDAAWTDPARFCVQGSRVAAANNNTASQAVDPLFESSSQKSAGGGSADGAGAASAAGDSKNGADSDSAAAMGKLQTGQGSRAVAVAVLAAAATWLWIV